MMGSINGSVKESLEEQMKLVLQGKDQPLLLLPVLLDLYLIMANVFNGPVIIEQNLGRIHVLDRRLPLNVRKLHKKVFVKIHMR